MSLNGAMRFGRALSQGDSWVKEPSQLSCPIQRHNIILFYTVEYELEVMNSIGIDEVILGC